MKKKNVYGMCECPQAGYMCCGGRGPAVFLVERDGVKLKLCTRCNFGSDVLLKVLVKSVTEELVGFDAFGALCLEFALKDSKK